MSWQKVFQEFMGLDEAGQRLVLLAIRGSKASEETSFDFSAIREKRFATGLVCPHCKQTSLKRNGKYTVAGNSRQRYLCSECGKSSNDLTASPISGTRYPDKWLEYFRFMLEGLSLRKIASLLGIHLSTAFYWRHKILTALQVQERTSLSGIAEGDETYFRESEKGNKNITRRKPKKRGHAASKRGISREQVCVFVARDRSGRVFSKTACMGQMSIKHMDNVAKNSFDEVNEFCSDSASVFKKFCQKKNIHHRKVNVRKKNHVDGIYHIQNVNNYHGRLKRWMGRFYGVATKYLNNYLSWFKFLEIIKSQDEESQLRSFLTKSCSRPKRTTISNIRNYAKKTANVFDVTKYLDELLAT